MFNSISAGPPGGSPEAPDRSRKFSQMTIFRPYGELAFCVVAAAMLAGCAADRPFAIGEPSAYRSLAQAGVRVDAKAAASLISRYRRNYGLGPVVVDPALMRLAQRQAQAMAREDALDHNAAGSFADRMSASGYPYQAAGENIGVGYGSLAEAFSGWRNSPPHRANLLRRSVTRIGIAAVYRPKSQWKTFWALILAAPLKAPGVGARGSTPYLIAQ
jgi:Cysteine-rich secretory protein family